MKHNFERCISDSVINILLHFIQLFLQHYIKIGDKNNYLKVMSSSTTTKSVPSCSLQHSGKGTPFSIVLPLLEHSSLPACSSCSLTLEVACPNCYLKSSQCRAPLSSPTFLHHRICHMMLYWWLHIYSFASPMRMRAGTVTSISPVLAQHLGREVGGGK